MKDHYDFSNAERGKFYRKDAAFEKLRADVEAGSQQLEDGRVTDFDPEAVKRRGREKLAVLRAATGEPKK
jgi:hypothetical protein